MTAKETIQQGKAILGIEFGSTRIKAVVIDEENKPIAQGSHTWENQLVDGLWTYSIDTIWNGLQDCYADLRANVLKEFGVEIETFAAIGISAMMHGYMAFNEKDEILVPFRTWRNTNTGKAAAELSSLFNYNIPLRWSISHLYECILEDNEHVKDIKFQTTLAGYIHWQLTGEKVHIEALHILNNVEGIGVVNLDRRDIVRHKLVTKIVNAYEEYDKERNNNNETQRYKEAEE